VTPAGIQHHIVHELALGIGEELRP